MLDVAEGVEDFGKLLTAALFFQKLPRLRKSTLLVANVGGTRTTRIIRVDADPLSLELRLDHFEAFEGGHVLVGRLSWHLLRWVVL